MESSNPTLNGRIFAKARAALGSGTTMTVAGTANKALILLGVLLFTAGWSYTSLYQPEMASKVSMAAMVSGIIGFILAIATTFKPNWSPITAPLYSACQGVLMGAVSAMFEQKYPGIVLQAVGLTMAALFTMLVAYRTGWIQATEGFRRGLMIAMFALIGFYVVVFIAGLFGVQAPSFINGASPLGIAFSMFVVGLATLNLILDFDFIERASEEGLEKYMEWYGAFTLMVTLVWLYMEMLRLLSKLQRRD